MNLAAICHTQRSVDLLDSNYQNLTKDLAGLPNLNSSFTPFQNKQSLWKVMAKNRIEIAAELFSNLGSDHSLEMWAVTTEGKFQFILAMGDIMRRSSYSLEELSTLSWAELFTRPPQESAKIVEAVTRALQTGVSQLNVTDWHFVTEAKSLEQRSFEVIVTQFTPFIGPNNSKGVFALVKSKQLGELSRKAVEAAPTTADNIQPSYQN